MFQDRVFWVDVVNAAIYGVDKYTGGDVVTLVSNLYQPQDVIVYHPLMQPTGKKPVPGP